MSIDERELRARLSSTAVLAGPPQFTADGVAARVRRIRRRRSRRAGVIASVCVAAVAAAVAIPLIRGGTGERVMRAAPAPATVPRLSYTVTVNGQTRTAPATGTGALPLFTITPGERLTMTVVVTVPGRHAITALWLGITNGTLAPGPGGPAGMSPVLTASTGAPLRPGAHRFVLHWTVPAGLKPGATRELSAQWATSGAEPADIGSDVAEFAVPLPARATRPAAVTRRLRALALHAVHSCGGAGPAWIRAVRTTFGKAMAIPDVAQGDNLAVNASAAVYLVLMKGDFTFSDGGPVPSGVCAHGPSGRYFSAMFDAATFVTLDEGLGNRPFPAALRTLGPVLNLTARPAG